YSSPGKWIAKLIVRNNVGGVDSMQFCIAVGSFSVGYDVTRIADSLLSSNDNNPDLGVVRDNFYAPPGSDSLYPQFISQHYSGSPIDSVGYTFPSVMTFSSIIFQEGKNSSQGGWFTSINAQVRVSGVWTNVGSLQISPAYAGNNGVNYDLYVLSFSPLAG